MLNRAAFSFIGWITIAAAGVVCYCGYTCIVATVVFRLTHKLSTGPTVTANYSCQVLSVLGF